MSFIPKEIPVGVVNWVNTVFTFLNDIEYITSIYLDGAIYIDFVREGTRSIRLTDAPTISIFWDYYTADSILPIETNVSLWDVKSKIWRLLWQRGTSVNFDSATITGEINDLMQEIWRGKYMNTLTNQYMMSDGMFFQENYHSFRISKDWAVTEDIQVWDSSIAMTTDWMNPAGWVLIGWDYIQYTSSTPTSIEWVSGITTSHSQWVIAKQLYVFPENYDVIIEADEVWYFASSVTYTPIDLDGRVKFDIIRIWGVPLMEVRGLQNGTIVRTKYITKYVDMVEDAEDFKLPDRYGTSCIAYIVAGEMWAEKGLIHSQTHLKRWYDRLIQMWDFYNKKTKRVSKIRPKPYAKIWRTAR